MPQCSFIQELFDEDDVPKEIVPIEQPWVNIINLSDDYVDSPWDLVMHLFSSSLMLQTHAIPPQGPSTTLITPGNTRIKQKQLNVFSPIIDVIVKNNK
jgi:hypothetical protein